MQDSFPCLAGAPCRPEIPMEWTFGPLGPPRQLALTGPIPRVALPFSRRLESEKGELPPLDARQRKLTVCCFQAGLCQR